MKPVNIGIVGCGNISDTYFRGSAGSELVKLIACADLRAELAHAKAGQYNVAAATIDELLADRSIELVINLTPPLAHAEVGRRIIGAGKHVYSEKPLAATFEEARTLMTAAAQAGLRVGCAPDTFLGAGHQACRKLIDEGRIGRVIGGSAAVVSRGMESWHPNPEFFFKRGGGPVLDLGPYYVTQLINLLGPVRRVAAIASTGFGQRTVTSEPLRGQVIDVEVPTTVNGVLEFASGANFSITASWDVWGHKRVPFEIYGSEGSLLCPDPNWFGGAPSVSDGGAEWQDVDVGAYPFGAPNRTTRLGAPVADYRIAGVLDMAAAIRGTRDHRASGELALHTLEILEALLRSSLESRYIVLETTCERPAALGQGADEAVFLTA